MYIAGHPVIVLRLNPTSFHQALSFLPFSSLRVALHALGVHRPNLTSDMSWLGSLHPLPDTPTTTTNPRLNPSAGVQACKHLGISVSTLPRSLHFSYLYDGFDTIHASPVHTVVLGEPAPSRPAGRSPSSHPHPRPFSRYQTLIQSQFLSQKQHRNYHNR